MLKRCFKRIFILTIFAALFVSLGIVKAETYVVNQEELNQKVNELYSKVKESDLGYYKVNDIKVIEAENNFKEVSETKELKNLATDNKQEVRKMFDEKIEYSDDEYSGTLNLVDVEISGTPASYYEEILSHNVTFEDYSSNDLNEIKKTILVNGKTYYLINVDWKEDKTEVIDGQKVIQSYKGIANYQTIKRNSIPASFSAIAKYEGNVSKNNKEYILDIDYEFVNTEEPKDNTPAIITGTIIISGLGIAVTLLLVFTKNVKVYNMIENKEKLIGMYRISKSKMTLDLSKITLKGSNIYKIKLSKRIFNEIQNKDLTIIKPSGIKQNCNIITDKMTVIL